LEFVQSKEIVGEGGTTTPRTYLKDLEKLMLRIAEGISGID
jgi:hypothetical protein